MLHVPFDRCGIVTPMLQVGFSKSTRYKGTKEEYILYCELNILLMCIQRVVLL